MGEMRRPFAKFVFSAEDTPDLRSPCLQQVPKWEKGNRPRFMPILQMGKTEAMGPKANFSVGGQPINLYENHRLVGAIHTL